MKKLFLPLLVFAALQFAVAEEKSPWSFSNSLDFTYIPKTAYVSGGNHFAPITGAFSGVELRDRFSASYRLPISKSKNPLFSGNAAVFTGSLEISPVTFLPKISAKIIPIAFLEFEAGVSIGTGWPLPFMKLDGLAAYKSAKGKYEMLTPFASWSINPYVAATFQFDVAALWPGAWHHIVTQWTFTSTYSHLLTATDYDVFWLWQTGAGYANGWNYNIVGVLGYQMPIVLSMVGIRAEMYGHYSKADYKQYADSYNGNFTECQLAPLFQFSFGKKHTLNVLPTFRARRAFSDVDAGTTANDLPSKRFSGIEWQFYRIAFNWVMKI